MLPVGQSLGEKGPPLKWHKLMGAALLRAVCPFDPSYRELRLAHLSVEVLVKQYPRPGRARTKDVHLTNS